MVDYFNKDNILIQNNFSVPTDDLAFRLNKLWSVFEYSSSKILWWQEMLDAPFAKILAPWGICYSFNIAHANELIRLEKYLNSVTIIVHECLII